MFKKKVAKPIQRERVSKQPSRSSSVFSYHANRSRPESVIERVDTTSEPNVKNKSNRLLSVPGYVAIAIIVIAICYSTIISVGSPKIVPLSESTPTILRDTSEYEQGIAEIMGKSVWNRSKLTINTKELAEQIKEQYSELGSAAVTIPIIGRRPIVQIAPAKPALIVGSQNSGLIVGTDGRALMSLNELPENQLNDLIRVEDTLNTQVKMGELLLSSKTVDYIQQLKYYFGQKNITIDYVQLPAVANELHLRLKDTPYIIKFNMQSDSRQQAGSYLALIESLQSQAKPLPKEYVDVRIDDRVYYK